MVFNTPDYSQFGDSRKVSFDMSRLGLTGKVKVRDMWKKQNLGEFSGTGFAPEINSHGAGLYRLSK